jgi:hypothetical protein
VISSHGVWHGLVARVTAPDFHPAVISNPPRISPGGLLEPDHSAIGTSAVAAMIALLVWSSGATNGADLMTRFVSCL